jgi:hypothetical protein
MLLIFIPIPQFSNFLLLIVPNSFAAETFMAWALQRGLVGLHGGELQHYGLLVME